MRLTPDVITKAPTFMNAIEEWTISLRDIGVVDIENLDVTGDVFECVDLTNNEIVTLAPVPRMYKLKTVLVSRNNINSIDESFVKSLCNVASINLAFNNISDFSCLHQLQYLKNLKTLIVAENPISNAEHYRLFLIHILPQLEVLDYAKVTQNEKSEAEAKFKQTGLLEQLVKQRSSAVQPIKKSTGAIVAAKLNEVEKSKLKQELMNAKSIEEMNRIEKLLEAGF